MTEQQNEAAEQDQAAGVTEPSPYSAGYGLTNKFRQDDEAPADAGDDELVTEDQAGDELVTEDQAGDELVTEDKPKRRGGRRRGETA